jgi:hypothetical protein
MSAAGDLLRSPLGEAVLFASPQSRVAVTAIRAAPLIINGAFIVIVIIFVYLIMRLGRQRNYVGATLCFVGIMLTGLACRYLLQKVKKIPL